MDVLSRKITLLKVIVLGDSGVGKTSLIHQYVHKMLIQKYKATIGADFLRKELQIDDEQVILQADPVAPEKYPFVLIGNKIDIDGGNSRAVSEKQAMEWCASKGNITYYETSAKEGKNVDETFLCVARAALSNEHRCELNLDLPGITEPLDIEQKGFCGC